MTAFGMGYTALREVELGASRGSREQPREADVLLRAETPAADESAGGGGIVEWRDRLLTFIPGDIVGGYTLVAACASSSSRGPLIAAVVFTVLAPFVVLWGLHAKAKEIGLPNVRGHLPWFRMIAAPISFATWVIALPGSPADWWGQDAGWIKALALVAVAIVISGLANRFDNAPAMA